MMSKEDYIKKMYISEIIDTNTQYKLTIPIETPIFDVEYDDIGCETSASFDKNKMKVLHHYELTVQKFNYER